MRKLLFAAVLAILGTSKGATAEEFVRIEMNGPLTPEIKWALAKLLDAADTHDSIETAAAEAMTVDELCVSVACSAAQRRIIDNIGEGGDLLPDISTPLAAAGPMQATVPTVSLPNVTGQTADFLIISPENDLRRVFRESIEAAGVAASDVAVIPAESVGPAVTSIVGNVEAVENTSVGAVVLQDGASNEIARLDHDIEAFGSTARTVPVKGADPAVLEELSRAVAASGGSVSTETSARPDVDIDWPLDVSGLAQGDAACDAEAGHWPFDASLVGQRLKLAAAVLEAMGQRHFPRSNVLIVDSGIEPALADLPLMRPSLHADIRELMGGGRYLQGTDTSQFLCDDPDGELTDLAFGHVPNAAIRGHLICTSLNPLKPPPRAPEAGGTYRPEHGGFVGALAAGGPALLEAGAGADAFVGVSFSRIMWSREGSDLISSDIPDVVEAFEYATRRRADVVNASLWVRNDLQSRLANKVARYQEGGGLVVAAAGNIGAELQAGTASFPASLVAGGEDDRLIVVGGLVRNDTAIGGVGFWPSSAFSRFHVDIAAPAAEVPSFGLGAGMACMSGTSAAAPLVSFTTAALKTLGYRSPEEMKRRVLATADIRPSLADKIRDGRVLNVVNALDVFVDLLWIGEDEEPVRAHLLPPEGAGQAVLFRACNETSETLAAANGWLDASRLVAWRRLDDRTAEVWHATANNKVTKAATRCTTVPGRLRYLDLSNGQEREVEHSALHRVVPSRLRVALPVARPLVLQDGF